VASLSQGRTAAAQCGLFTYKSVPVIFEPPCIKYLIFNPCNSYVVRQIFLLPKISKPVWGPSNMLANWLFFLPRIKYMWLETDHWPQSSAQPEIALNYSLPPLTHTLSRCVAWLSTVIILLTEYTVCPTSYRTGWLADRCSLSQQLGALQTHSFSFLTQRTYSCSNFVAISL